MQVKIFQTITLKINSTCRPGLCSLQGGSVFEASRSALADIMEWFFRQNAAGEYLLSGRLEIDYLNNNYEFNLPTSDEYETLAGLILHFHPSLPKVHETIRIPGFSFRITAGNRKRISVVALSLTDAWPPTLLSSSANLCPPFFYQSFYYLRSLIF